ncbi:hypothetical protein BMS3Abin17_01293 [archaeon BMS3Abin17]|nr:hypothetical protein BMS3Abin17_01293 [archaeon BMS3Abin17]HDZ61428.1 hypothetical protein [Candidatus Pacearchaeota archaeon]
MESEIRDLKDDIKKLIADVTLIKNLLVEEGELSDWAVNELEEARKIPESECVSHKEAKRIILQK